MTLSAEHLERFVDELLSNIDWPPAYALTCMRLESLGELAVHEKSLEAQVCVQLIADQIDLIPIADDPLLAAVQLRSRVMAVLAAGGCFGRVIQPKKKDH